MAEQEVIRQYQALPAIEQTKLIILNQLNVLFNSVNSLIQIRLLNRIDDEVTSAVKSSLITIYMMLKPKIREHILAKSKLNLNNDERDAIESLMSLVKLDEYMLSPTQLSIEDSLKFADIINLFCHEYGVTRITFFSGTAMTTRGTDIMNI